MCAERWNRDCHDPPGYGAFRRVESLMNSLRSVSPAGEADVEHRWQTLSFAVHKGEAMRIEHLSNDTR